jgi:hypothetical protein
MSVEFHDPRGEARKTAEPYICRLPRQDAPVLGLLANGFPDSESFLDAVEQAIGEARPEAEVRRYNKHGPSAPASGALVARIVEECDAVLTAYGH